LEHLQHVDSACYDDEQRDVVVANVNQHLTGCRLTVSPMSSNPRDLSGREHREDAITVGASADENYV
jgi:hypothetical protein